MKLSYGLCRFNKLNIIPKKIPKNNPNPADIKKTTRLVVLYSYAVLYIVDWAIASVIPDMKVCPVNTNNEDMEYM